ncbi:hypothetical protein WMY93_011579 [Mugilogobius chulae]|uniref:Uncharacterized protein n=1 Tax=Mugilogobius chulae TaxID=88201 RepID=A0AAW0PF47_9GOBI
MCFDLLCCATYRFTSCRWMHLEKLFCSGQSCLLIFTETEKYSTAADNTPPPRWVQLEPELEEALVPRKLSVSPLESWLSLRYSLPPALEPVLPEEDVSCWKRRSSSRVCSHFRRQHWVSHTP